jgi:Family of unknown function (DUF6522)
MIDIEDNGASFTIPAEVIAAALKCDAATIPELVRTGAITMACERGTDEDAGTWRLTISDSHVRLRLIVDALGTIINRSVLNFGSQPLPPGTRRPGAV